MTEETTTLTEQTPPPVRDWPALDLTGTEFDPVLAEFMRESPLIRIRLPHGEGWTWPATRCPSPGDGGSRGQAVSQSVTSTPSPVRSRRAKGPAGGWS